MTRRQRRRSEGGSSFFSPPVLGGLAGALLLVVAVVFFWGRSGSDPEPSIPPADAAPSAEAPAADEVEPALPELSRSDQFIRDTAARLSAHPQLASWLVTEGLAHRFTASVAALAGRGSPAPHLEFMAPEAEFAVRESGEQLVIDAQSHRRYDLLAETVASLDAEGAASLYERLSPLLEEAHRELGLGSTFEETLELAVQNVLAVQVPQGPIEVYPSTESVVYEYVDPSLEGSSPAAKHLVRAGPENAQRIQAKVEEIARAIGLDVD